MRGNIRFGYGKTSWSKVKEVEVLFVTVFFYGHDKELRIFQFFSKVYRLSKIKLFSLVRDLVCFKVAMQISLVFLEDLLLPIFYS